MFTHSPVADMCSCSHAVSLTRVQFRASATTLKVSAGLRITQALETIGGRSPKPLSNPVKSYRAKSHKVVPVMSAPPSQLLPVHHLKGERWLSATAQFSTRSGSPTSRRGPSRIETQLAEQMLSEKRLQGRGQLLKSSCPRLGFDTAGRWPDMSRESGVVETRPATQPAARVHCR